MIHTDIRIVQNQEETISNSDISQDEVNKLLMKYNYVNDNSVMNNLSFEDMVKKEEEIKYFNKLSNQTRPRAITFNDRNINYHETKSCDVDGISFEVKICTDIPTDTNFRRNF